jgi:hypothetical protein
LSRMRLADQLGLERKARVRSDDEFQASCFFASGIRAI